MRFRAVRRWILGTISLLLLSLWGGVIHGQAATVTATIDYAKTGDTLELLWPLEAESPVTTLRLKDLEAPDREQSPWGAAARNCLKPLRNKVVRIEADSWTPDSRERLWVYGWHGKTLVNAQVLEQGCAYLAGDRLTHGRHATDMIYAQERARLLGLGIWNPQKPLRETAEDFRARS